MANDETLRIKEVSLSTSNLTKTLEFWETLLEMQVVSKDTNQAVLNYDPKTQTNLRFVTSETGCVDHATGKCYYEISCHLKLIMMNLQTN